MGYGGSGLVWVVRLGWFDTFGWVMVVTYFMKDAFVLDLGHSGVEQV